MPLNAEGVALAKRLGDDLGKLQATSKRPIKITFHSSPVLRCIETAELMMERVGMSTAAVVECTALCASPYDGSLDGWKA
jgi:broad specificity phosphatase PhoE